MDMQMQKEGTDTQRAFPEVMNLIQVELDQLEYAVASLAERLVPFRNQSNAVPGPKDSERPAPTVSPIVEVLTVINRRVSALTRQINIVQNELEI